MELIILTGNYLYFSDLIFELLVLILLLLVGISILSIICHYTYVLFKKIYIRLYPYKTATVVPLPLASVISPYMINSETDIPDESTEHEAVDAIDVIIQHAEIVS